MTSDRWWRDGPALPPPAPPAGLGPRLGSWTEGRWARRRLFLKVLLALAVLWAVVALSHPTPPAYGFGLATLLATWLLLVYANPARAVAVGEDWLRVRAGRRDGWVRTDQLTRAALEVRWTRRLLALEDRGGRRLRVDLDELFANPVVREAFLAAVRRSRAAGMTANRGTAATLSLDGQERGT
ncbi:MAG TPA: hypothetical protein VFD04_23715 [Actinomycetes bacterium]|nr:hypothetical protein [Actinomycetes bacterium]